MKRLNVKILLVFLSAFLIRLIALNQSLWLDEAVTANVIKNLGFSQIVGGFSPSDFHPPLYYLFMKLWTNFFGYSEIALRVPSVLFSLLTGWIIYKICHLRQGFGEPMWSAAFFLFNPLIIYYSQEARMYIMATLFLTVSLYFLLTSLRVNEFKKRNLILFNLFIILSFYTFYGSIFMIVSMYIYLLYKKQYKMFFVSCFLFLVSFILINPLLYQQFLHSRIALSNVTNWSLVLGKANIKNLLLIPIKFSIGRISFYPKWLYWGIAGIWTGFILYQILKIKNQSGKSRLKNIYLFYYLLIFPLVLGFLVSFFIPMLQYFRFIYLIPIMTILLSLNKNTSMYRYIVIIGFVVFSLTYLLLSQFHREDWKSLVKNLPKNKKIYMITTSSDPLKYYNPNLSIKELRITDYESKDKEIIVIPYTADIYGFDYKKSLTKSGYQQKEVKNFRELSFEIWSRR